MGTKPNVLVIACGGIGGTIATHLAAAETCTLTVLSTNTDVVAAVQEHGFRLSGVGPSIEARGTIVSEIPEDTFDFILLATQPPQVEEAVRNAVHTLADNGAMVVLQNGLCEDRVAKICGSERTFGGIVTFGGSTDGPGEFRRTSRGGILLGRMDGKKDPRLDVLAGVLDPVAEIGQTHNLLGARFSKLAMNCSVSSLGTVAGVRLGEALSNRVARNLALGIMREAVAVSRAESVTLERLNGTFDLNWLADPDAQTHGVGHWARHLVVMGAGIKYRKLRSSMLRAIEKGRPPAIEFLNGEIVTRGAEHGIPVPVNAAVRDLVHKIAQGETSPSPTHFDAIWEKLGQGE